MSRVAIPHNPAPKPAGDGDGDGSDGAVEFALELIGSRQTVLPKRLGEPGPSDTELDALLRAAAAAPDHGLLTPWRFIVVPRGRRHRLADAFARALADRDPAATAEQLEDARAKAHRAPLLLIAIARLGTRDPDTPPLERMISMGAAIQNILLAAHAMGYAAALTSGRAMASARMGALCGLGDGEAAVCCISIGTAASRPQPKRVRPLPADFVTVLPAGPEPD